MSVTRPQPCTIRAWFNEGWGVRRIGMILSMLQLPRPMNDLRPIREARLVKLGGGGAFDPGRFLYSSGAEVLQGTCLTLLVYESTHKIYEAVIDK